MDRIKLAQEVCKEAHEGQFRRTGEPYFTHPFTVADMLNNEDEKIVAYLHDVLEDTSIDAYDVYAKFVDAGMDAGKAMDMVHDIELLTKKKGQDYADYLNAVCISKVATKVKIADMVHNLSCDPTVKQKKKYREGVSFLLNSL